MVEIMFRYCLMNSCLKNRDEREERNSRYKPLERVLVEKEIAFLGLDVIAERLSKRKSLDDRV